MASWKIDPAHTDISFSATHMMVTTVRGKFHSVGGEVALDETDPPASRAEITIDAASISTGFAARDQHLRSPDFLDVQQFPAIRFVTTRIAALSDERFRIDGELTIRDASRPVTFDADFLGFYTGLKGGRRAGFRASLEINRRDWGLAWNVALEKGGWLVGDQIGIALDVALEEAVVAADESPSGATPAPEATREPAAVS